LNTDFENLRNLKNEDFFLSENTENTEFLIFDFFKE
jgi:hypothetical protein